MPSAERVQKVARLKGRIEASQALLLAEYRGLTVHDATELRRTLGPGTRFSVVKNTLMKRAAGKAGLAQIEALLEGPTAVAFVSEDPVAAAKRIVDATRRFPTLVLKGAYMEGRVLGADDARGLAELESREVMLSRIAGAMKAEMSRAAAAFQALQARFLGVLEAYREKLPPGDGDGAGVGAPRETPPSGGGAPEAAEGETEEMEAPSEEEG
jgi:large subunit ribosomal protein L10